MANGPKNNDCRLIRIGRKKKLAAMLLGILATLFRIENWLKWLFPSLRQSGRDNTVTVLEPFGMGDVISLEPMIRLLKEKGVDVIIAARKQWAPLFPMQSCFEWINTEVPWSSYSVKDKYRASSIFSAEFRLFLHNLRAGCSGTIGVDSRGDIRSIILLYLAGCRKVLSLESYLGTDLPVLSSAACLMPCNQMLKRWEQNLEFLSLLGFAVDKSMKLAPNMRHLAGSSPEKSKVAVGLIAVAPWPGRKWPSDRWQSLAAGLRSRGFQPVAYCGPGQKADGEECFGGKVEVTEIKDVEEWADRLSRLCCVVSLDSGPMHLADALGVPVIGLFGQGKLPLWAPSGPLSVVIHHQSESNGVPCHQVDEFVETAGHAMEQITVDEVLAAVTGITRTMEERA